MRFLASVIDSLPDIPDEIKGSLHNLRRLRNEAAHAREETVSRDAAVEYVHSCITMLNWLQGYQLGRQSSGN